MKKSELRQIIKEEIQKLHESKVNYKKWLKHPDVLKWVIDKNIAKKFYAITKDIEEEMLTADADDYTIANWYEKDGFIWDDKKDDWTIDKEFTKKTREDAKSTVKKLKSEHNKIMKQVFGKYPYVKQVEKLIHQQNLGFSLINDVEIEKINPNMNSIHIGNWNGVAKLQPNDFEDWNITQEQFIATVMSLNV